MVLGAVPLRACDGVDKPQTGEVRNNSGPRKLCSHRPAGLLQLEEGLKRVSSAQQVERNRPVFATSGELHQEGISQQEVCWMDQRLPTLLRAK